MRESAGAGVTGRWNTIPSSTLSKLGMLTVDSTGLVPARHVGEEEGGGDGDGDGDDEEDEDEDDDDGGVGDELPRRQDLVRSRDDVGADDLVGPL
jgi:hypothetical protein